LLQTIRLMAQKKLPSFRRKKKPEPPSLNKKDFGNRWAISSKIFSLFDYINNTNACWYFTEKRGADRVFVVLKTLARYNENEII